MQVREDRDTGRAEEPERTPPTEVELLRRQVLKLTSELNAVRCACLAVRLMGRVWNAHWALVCLTYTPFLIRMSRMQGGPEPAGS